MYLFQLRKSWKTKWALEETRSGSTGLEGNFVGWWVCFIPRSTEPHQVGPPAPCLCLVLSCSLTALSPANMSLTYGHHMVLLRRSEGLWNSLWRLESVLLRPLVLPLSLDWERSLSLVHFLSKLTKESSEVPGAGSWSSPKGPPQGLPGSLIIGLLGGASEIQKDLFCN